MDKERLLLEETLYSTANGYIGVRANLEEGMDGQSIRGAYINGVYGLVDIVYGENCYGFPQAGETIVNLVDVQGIDLYIDNEKFSMFEGEISNYYRQLDIKKGYAVRHLIWQSPKGHQVEIEIKRMTSFVHLEAFIIDYTVRSINFEGPVGLVSRVNCDVSNFTDQEDPRVSSHKVEHVETQNISLNPITIDSQIKRSGLKVQVEVSHSLEMTDEINESQVISTYQQNLRVGESISLVKYVTFNSARHHLSVLDLKAFGLKKLYEEQKTYLDKFWKTAYINIEGDQKVMEALNYNSYQLLASAGKDGYTNIAAKGLSGEGYEGHYFWDTEIYMLPLFTLTSPDLAKNLLIYRYHTLDQAKSRAKDFNHLGAKYPWRTISGLESSPYYPAGSAQYHINGDIAYAIIQYYLMTDDLDFIKDYGYEILHETAKLWLDCGHYVDDKFRIDCVTGPDEYTALVNNNYYTNALAAYHMKWLVIFSDLLGINDKTLGLYENASTNMYLPYDEVLDVHLQDDHFLQRKPWDFVSSEGKHPLLMYYHPLVIYRHQVLKQADTVLAHFLLDDSKISTMKNSYDMYEKITTHDSSLSYCVYGMMAARFGDVKTAYDYFMKSIRLDLDDLHGNTKDGLHVANSGGAYMFIPFGFAGLRIKDNISISPVLPNKWQSYEFSIVYKKQDVKFKISNVITIEANDLVIRVYDHLIHVKGTYTTDMK